MTDKQSNTAKHAKRVLASERKDKKLSKEKALKVNVKKGNVQGNKKSNLHKEEETPIIVVDRDKDDDEVVDISADLADMNRSDQTKKVRDKSRLIDFVVHDNGLGSQLTEEQRGLVEEAYKLVSKVTLTENELAVPFKPGIDQKKLCISMSENGYLQEYLSYFPKTDWFKKRLAGLYDILADSVITQKNPRVIFNLVNGHIIMVNGMPYSLYIPRYRANFLREIMNELGLGDVKELSNKQIKRITYHAQFKRKQTIFGAQASSYKEQPKLELTERFPNATTEGKNVFEHGYGVGAVTRRDLSKGSRYKESLVVPLPEYKETVEAAPTVVVKPISKAANKVVAISGPLTKEQKAERKRLAKEKSAKELENRAIAAEKLQKKLDRDRANKIAEREYKLNHPPEALVEARRLREEAQAQRLADLIAKATAISEVVDNSANEGVFGKGPTTNADPGGDGPRNYRLLYDLLLVDQKSHEHQYGHYQNDTLFMRRSIWNDNFYTLGGQYDSYKIIRLDLRVNAVSSVDQFGSAAYCQIHSAFIEQPVCETDVPLTVYTLLTNFLKQFSENITVLVNVTRHPFEDKIVLSLTMTTYTQEHRRLWVKYLQRMLKKEEVLVITSLSLVEKKLEITDEGCVACTTLNGNNGEETNSDCVMGIRGGRGSSSHTRMQDLRSSGRKPFTPHTSEPKWMKELPGMERIEPTPESMARVKAGNKATEEILGYGGWDDDDFGRKLKFALDEPDSQMNTSLKYQEKYLDRGQSESCRPVKGLLPVFIAKSVAIRGAEYFHMVRNAREKREGWQIRKMYSEMKKKGKARKAAVFEFCSCGGECDKEKFCRAWSSDITKEKPRLYIASCQRPHRCTTSDCFINAGIERVNEKFCEMCECEDLETLPACDANIARDVTHMYAVNGADDDDISSTPSKGSAISASPEPGQAQVKKERLPLLRSFNDGGDARFGDVWEKKKEAGYEAEYKRRVGSILVCTNRDALARVISLARDQIIFSTERTPPILIKYNRSVVAIAEKRLQTLEAGLMVDTSHRANVEVLPRETPVMRASTIADTTPQPAAMTQEDSTVSEQNYEPDDGDWGETDSVDVLPEYEPTPSQISSNVDEPAANDEPAEPFAEPIDSLPQSIAETPAETLPRGSEDGEISGITMSAMSTMELYDIPSEGDDPSDGDDDVEEIIFHPVEVSEPQPMLSENIAISSQEDGAWCASMNTSVLKIPGSTVSLYQYDKAKHRVRCFIPGENEEYATGPISPYIPVLDGTEGLLKSKTHCGLYIADHEKMEEASIANALIRYVSMTIEADEIAWFKGIRTFTQRMDQLLTKRAGKRIGYLRSTKTAVMPVMIPFVTFLCAKNSPLLVSELSTQNLLCELKRFTSIIHGYLPVDITIGTFLYIIKKNYELHLNAHAVSDSLIEVNSLNVGHRSTFLDQRLDQVTGVKLESQSAPGVFFTPYTGVTMLDGVAIFKLNSDESYFLDSFGRVKPEYHHLTLSSVRFQVVKTKGNVISYNPLQSQIIFNTAQNPILSRRPRFAISHNFLTFGNQANAQNHLDPTVQSAAMLRLLQPRSNEQELFEAQRRTAIEIIYTMAKLMDSGVVQFNTLRSDDLWRQFASYAKHNEENLHQYNDKPHGSIAVLRNTFCADAYEAHWIYSAEWKSISAGVIANAIINICQRKSEAFDAVESLLSELDTDRERAVEEAIRYVGGPKMSKRLAMFETLKRNPLVLHTIEKMAVAQIKPFEFQKIKSKGSDQYLQYARIVANLTERFYFYQNPAAHRIHKKTLSNIYVFNLLHETHPTIQVEIHDYDNKKALEEIFVFSHDDPDLSRFTPFVAGSPLSGGTSQYYGVYYTYIMAIHQRQLSTHRDCRTPQWIITYSDDSITYKAGKVNESDITKNDLSHTIYSFCVCYASNCERLAEQLLTSYEVASWPIRVQAVEMQNDYVVLLASFLAFLFSGGMLTTGTNNKQDMVCLILTIQGGSSSDYGFEMTENIMDAHKASFLSHVYTRLELPMSAAEINLKYMLECKATGKKVEPCELYPTNHTEIYVAFKLPATILRKFGRRDVAYTRHQTPEEEIYKDILGAAAHSQALYVKALRIGYVTNVLRLARPRGKNAASRKILIVKELITYTAARAEWALKRPALNNEDYAILRAHMSDSDDFNELLVVYCDFCKCLISDMRPSGYMNHKMVDIFNRKRYDMRESCWSDDLVVGDGEIVDPNLDLFAMTQQ